MHFREIGLSIASGIISLGNPKIFVIGEIKLIMNSKIPELLRTPIATNKPINVGKILITISIPSLAPSKKMSKTGFFSFIPYNKIIKKINGIAKLEK